MAKFNFQLIRFRLPSAFALAGVVVLGVSVVSIAALSSSSGALKTVANKTLPLLTVSGELSQSARALTSETNSFANISSEFSREAGYDTLDSLLNSIDEDVAELKESIKGENLDLVEAALSEMDTAVTSLNDVVEKRIATETALNQALRDAQTYRSAVADAVEKALDASDEGDIESFLRISLSANLLNSLYAEASLTETPEAVLALQDKMRDQADEILVNVAILGGMVTPELSNSTRTLTELVEGESSVADLKVASLGQARQASANADQASDAALKLKDSIFNLAQGLRNLDDRGREFFSREATVPTL